MDSYLFFVHDENLSVHDRLSWNQLYLEPSDVTDDNSIFSECHTFRMNKMYNCRTADARNPGYNVVKCRLVQLRYLTVLKLRWCFLEHDQNLLLGYPNDRIGWAGVFNRECCKFTITQSDIVDTVISFELKTLPTNLTRVPMAKPQQRESDRHAAQELALFLPTKELLPSARSHIKCSTESTSVRTECNCLQIL